MSVNEKGIVAVTGRAHFQRQVAFLHTQLNCYVCSFVFSVSQHTGTTGEQFYIAEVK